MARVIADIIDGDVRRAAGGDSARRVFRVVELSGSPAARLYNATQAGGVPRVGEAHPVLAGLQVLDVRASAENDPGHALVEVTYGVPTSTTGAAGSGNAEISIGSDLITEEIIRDVNGDLITTSHTYQIRLDGTTGSGFTPATGGVNGSITNSIVHRIEVQRPTFSVIYTRSEARPALARARAYAGKVNSTAFLGEAADRWLCNVESSQDSATAHRVRYSFTLNANGWQARVSHQLSGVVPTTLTATNGERIVQVYERADFGALRLPRI